jgi:hypothetical protein
MSRMLETRWLLKCDLEAVTPIHVGGMDGRAAADLPLAVDQSGTGSAT